MGEFAVQYAETLSRILEIPVCITDKDVVIATSGVPKKEVVDKKVSTELEKVMEDKTIFVAKADKGIDIVYDNENYIAGIAAPIIFEGDGIGTVTLLMSGNSAFGDVEIKLAEAAAMFLGKTME